MVLAACSESHAGRKPRSPGATDAAPGTDGSAEPTSWTEAEAAPSAPVQDARTDGASQTDAARAPQALSTGSVRAIAALGNTVKAVRADADQVSFSVRAVEPCSTTPASVQQEVDVTVTHQDCEVLGPIEVNASERVPVVLTVWLWRSNAPCGDDAVTSQRTLQLGLGPDCLRACDNALGCQRGARVACSEDTSCAPGLACVDGRCRWSTLLGQDARHVCHDHTECAPGLLCVEGDAEEPREPHCDVPCNATDMLCPGIHYCTRNATYTSAHWVCEWGGE